MLLDEDAGLFMVTSARNWEEANPDVLSFSDVTGCKLDIDERRTEIEYRDKDGERQSFNPKRYAYSYDFYIVINVNNPYFSEIRFQLNSSSVDNDEETLLDGPNAMRRPRGGLRAKAGGMGGGSLTSNAEEVRSSVEYRQYEEMGCEIRDALLQVRQQAREACGQEKLLAGFMGTGIFEQCHFLMGFEDTLTALYEHPQEMHELIEYITEYRLGYVKLLIDNLQPDVIFSHDDWGTKNALFMQPEMWLSLIHI
mgnify:CR=1 FL=1